MHTVERLFFMAMIAAMKNVLSPISDTRIIPLQAKRQRVIDSVLSGTRQMDVRNLCFARLTMI